MGASASVSINDEVGRAFIEACAIGDLEMVQRLLGDYDLKEGAETVTENSQAELAETKKPEAHASSSSSTMVESMDSPKIKSVAYRQALMNYTCPAQLPALSAACRNRRSEIVSYLISQGASVNIKCMWNDSAYTPLHALCSVTPSVHSEVLSSGAPPFISSEFMAVAWLQRLQELLFGASTEYPCIASLSDSSIPFPISNYLSKNDFDAYWPWVEFSTTSRDSRILLDSSRKIWMDWFCSQASWWTSPTSLDYARRHPQLRRIVDTLIAVNFPFPRRRVLHGEALNELGRLMSALTEAELKELLQRTLQELSSGPKAKTSLLNVAGRSLGFLRRCTALPRVQSPEESEVQIAELLVKAGADLNVHSPSSAKKVPLLLAAKPHNSKLFETICKASFKYHNPIDLTGKMGVSLAEAALSNEHALRSLIEAGLNPNIGNLRSLLCQAIINSSVEAVSVLLNAGASILPTVSVKSFAERSTLLQSFFQTFNIKSSESLASSSPSQFDEDQKVLGDKSRSAFSCNDFRSVTWAQHWANLGSEFPKDFLFAVMNNSALHVAVGQNKPQFLPLLVKAARDQDVSIDFLVPNGSVPMTPIVSAVQNRRIECLSFLLEHGANPNPRGYSLLCAAARLGSASVVKVLLEAGVSPNQDEYGEEGQFGYTALAITTSANCVGCVEIAKVLLEHRASLKFKPKYFPPLNQLARLKGNEELARLLEEYEITMVKQAVFGCMFQCFKAQSVASSSVSLSVADSRSPVDQDVAYTSLPFYSFLTSDIFDLNVMSIIFDFALPSSAARKKRPRRVAGLTNETGGL